MQTTASHTDAEISALAASHGAGLGAKEIYDPGQNLRLDVKDVSWTARGAEVTVEVFTNAAFYCPDVLVVVRDAGSGRLMMGRYFSPEGYYVLGFLKSGLIPCRQTGVLVLPSAERGQNVVFELYSSGADLDALQGAQPLAQSRAYQLGELRERAQEQRDAPSPVEETVAGYVAPVVKWALIGTGAYVALQNRRAIADAVGNLLSPS